MLKPEDNERLVRVGRGKPAGELFRRYWIPALLSSEVDEPDGPPARVRLLGEDLVAFRDTNGRVGLVDAYCPHRRAPLFFGRNEECGIRCAYHGWKFDVDGNCLDTPAEPADTGLKSRIKLTAYPTLDRGGIVWAYLGPHDRQPPPPDFEWLRAPATHRHVSKTFEHCNGTLDDGAKVPRWNTASANPAWKSWSAAAHDHLGSRHQEQQAAYQTNSRRGRYDG